MTNFLLYDGGPIPLVALFLGLVGVPFTVLVSWAIGFMKWRIPASIGWIPATLAMVTAGVGLFYSTNMALSAISYASPEMRQTLLAAGLAASMASVWVGTSVLAANLLAYCAAAPLPAAIATGPNSHFSVPSIAASTAGAFVGGGLSLAAMFGTVGVSQLRELGIALFVLPPVAMLLTVGILVAAVRESDEREHQGRIAGARTSIVVAAVVALVMMGESFRIQGTILAFQAVAAASPEMKSLLLDRGLEIAGLASRFGWSMALMPLCAGIGSLYGVLGRVDSREFVGAAVAGIQVLIWMAVLAISAGRLNSIFDLVQS